MDSAGPAELSRFHLFVRSRNNSAEREPELKMIEELAKEPSNAPMRPELLTWLKFHPSRDYRPVERIHPKIADLCILVSRGRSLGHAIVPDIVPI